MAIAKKIGEKRVIPGKKSADLLNLRNEYIPKALYQVIPVFIAKAKGVVVEDVDGNEYLDFAAGIGALIMGHCHDSIVSAIQGQSKKYLHTAFNILMYEPYVMLAKKLTEITPGNFPKQVVFKNSGSEAIEDAVKIARRYTGRKGMIAFEGAYHGRTQIALALTSQVKYYKYHLGPFDPYVYHFPYPYTYRAPFGLAEVEYADYCIKRIKDSFKSNVAPDEIAAIVLETVLGIGGQVIAPPEFLKSIKRLCDEYGILLIVDEIFTGLGRTGKLWGVDHSGIVPDIVVTSKGLGGGMVLSATVSRKELLNVIEIGGLGGTFGGNPVSCVAALKGIEIIEQEKLPERAAELGEIARGRLQSMKDRYPLIGDVRAIGLSIGLELVKNRVSKEPASEEMNAILKKCHERGLILTSTGELKNVIRIIPPLVVKEEELAKGFDILETAIKEIQQ